MAVDFTPDRGTFTELKPFRFWCQKVLPLVYDDALSYYELLCRVVDYLNKAMEDVETLEGDVTNVFTAYESLQNYVNTYFDNLDVQEEINNKLDDMARTGQLNEIIRTLVAPAVSQWLIDNITPTTPVIDASLSVSGAGADSKVVGDKFAKTLDIKNSTSIVSLNDFGTGVFIIPSNYLSTHTDLPDTTTGIIVFSSVDGNNGKQIAVTFANNIPHKQWMRGRSSGTWGAWEEGIDQSRTISYKQTSGTMDADTVKAGYYVIQTGYLQNWSNLPPVTSGIFLICYDYETNGVQYAVGYANNVHPVLWQRNKSGGTWGTWYQYNLNAYMSTVRVIDGDANDFPVGSVYTITNDTKNVLNLPFSRIAVIVKTYSSTIKTDMFVQTCEGWGTNYTGIYAVRNNQGTGWNDWVILTDTPPNKKFGFTVIGDSLSCGWISTNESGGGINYYELSWGRHLARTLGVKCYISGSNGISSVDWMSDAVYGRLGVFQKFPTTPIYFIQLGVNDGNDNVTEANFKTAYRGIINAVRAKAPQALIVCLTLFRSGSPYAAYSNYIKSVVNEFSSDAKVFYLDVTNYITTNSDIKSHLYVGHYDPLGYALIGDYIYTALKTYLNSHPELIRRAFADSFINTQNAQRGYPYAY